MSRWSPGTPPLPARRTIIEKRREAASSGAGERKQGSEGVKNERTRTSGRGKPGQRTKARRKKSWGDRDELGAFSVDAHRHAVREVKVGEREHN